MNYESVIGLEVHVQIKTDSKLFCGCPTTFGAEPNTNICPVCCGYPGVLPVVNKKAVESLVKMGLAIGCSINEESIFARKQYFYPDLPKNYQISQYEKPLAEHGSITITLPEEQRKRIGVTRIHLEEDAGKLLHAVGSTELNYSLVDLNRTGIPLMEIVSEPDLRSSIDAQNYLETLKQILQYLEVSDCDMEKGSLRCDANVSIMPAGSKEFGKRVELKNMNSFRGVRDAIDYEIARQIRAVEAGEKITQETRLWDADKKESRPMRSKEQAHDYRYFPEPDLLPLKLESAWIRALKESLPELPEARSARLEKDYGLSAYDAGVLSGDKMIADYYESANRALAQKDPAAAKMLCNWITTELLGRLNQENRPLSSSLIRPEHLAELVSLIVKGTISGKIAKTVFEEMWASGKTPESIVKEKGLVQVSDESEIERWVDEALAQNPKAVQDYRSGNERAAGSFVGAVMKLSKGKANPELVNRIIKKKLAPSA